MAKPSTIPVLLLKTRSQPHDAYEEYFSPSKGDTRNFQPHFVPVLEHRPVVESVAGLEQLLNSGGLADKYGGMIFTSQRAVEAWADLVKKVEQPSKDDDASATGTGMVCPSPKHCVACVAHSKVRCVTDDHVIEQE